MTDLPKLLCPITTTSDFDWSWSEAAEGVCTATLPAGTWDTILELLADLDTLCTAETGDEIEWTISSNGIVTFTASDGDEAVWGSCDADLYEILGFAGDETMTAGGAIVATDRHLYGWYSPVGVDYPSIRRWMARSFERNDAGGVFVWASSAVHKSLTLGFSPLLEAQFEPGSATTESDGKGGTVDWTGRTFFDFWEDVAGLKFRFYEDGSLGTVAAPGTQGTDYLLCVRSDDEAGADQIDPDGYEWFSVSLPVLVDTE